MSTRTLKRSDSYETPNLVHGFLATIWLGMIIGSLLGGIILSRFIMLSIMNVPSTLTGNQHLHINTAANDLIQISGDNPVWITSQLSPFELIGSDGTILSAKNMHDGKFSIQEPVPNGTYMLKIPRIWARNAAMNFDISSTNGFSIHLSRTDFYSFFGENLVVIPAMFGAFLGLIIGAIFGYEIFGKPLSLANDL